MNAAQTARVLIACVAFGLPAHALLAGEPGPRWTAWAQGSHANTTGPAPGVWGTAGALSYQWSPTTSVYTEVGGSRNTERRADGTHTEARDRSVAIAVVRGLGGAWTASAEGSLARARAEAFDESGRRTAVDRTRTRKIKIGGGYAAAPGVGLSASTALLWKERNWAADQRLWTVAAAADYVLRPQRQWTPALGTEGTCTGETTDTGVDTDCSLEVNARIQLNATGGKGPHRSALGTPRTPHVKLRPDWNDDGEAAGGLRVVIARSRPATLIMSYLVE